MDSFFRFGWIFIFSQRNRLLSFSLFSLSSSHSLTRARTSYIHTLSFLFFFLCNIYIDIRKVLKLHEDLASIGLSWMWYGSSGNIAQPASIVQSCTKRANLTNYKSFIKISEAYKILKVHFPIFIYVLISYLNYPFPFIYFLLFPLTYFLYSMHLKSLL